MIPNIIISLKRQVVDTFFRLFPIASNVPHDIALAFMRASAKQ